MYCIFFCIFTLFVFIFYTFFSQVTNSAKFLKGTVDLRITDIQKDLKATNGEI